MARVDQLQAMLAREPNDPFVLYGLASEYAKMGMTAEAVVFFDRCLAADPDYLYAYYHKSKALGDADRAPEAIETLRVGVTRAKAVGDAKALNEMLALLDSME